MGFELALICRLVVAPIAGAKKEGVVGAAKGLVCSSYSAVSIPISDTLHIME